MIFRAFKFIAVSALLAMVKKAWARQSAKPAKAARPAAHAAKHPKPAHKTVHTLRPRRKSASTSHSSH